MSKFVFPLLAFLGGILWFFGEIIPLVFRTFPYQLDSYLRAFGSFFTTVSVVIYMTMS